MPWLQKREHTHTRAQIEFRLGGNQSAGVSCWRRAGRRAHTPLRGSSRGCISYGVQWRRYAAAPRCRAARAPACPLHGNTNVDAPQVRRPQQHAGRRDGTGADVGRRARMRVRRTYSSGLPGSPTLRAPNVSRGRLVRGIETLKEHTLAHGETGAGTAHDTRPRGPVHRGCALREPLCSHRRAPPRSHTCARRLRRRSLD